MWIGDLGKKLEAKKKGAATDKFGRTVSAVAPVLKISVPKLPTISKKNRVAKAAGGLGAGIAKPIVKRLEKRFAPAVTKVAKKVLKKVPLVGTAIDWAEDIGEVANVVGKALGFGKTKADKRKDRTRRFHKAIREGDWDHIQKTAEVEGALGGKGTRFQGLAEEALWALQQKEAGHSDAEIQAALRGSGGANARGGRLANLDGTSNTTRDQWNRLRAGIAPESSPPSEDPETTPVGDGPPAPRPPRESPATSAPSTTTSLPRPRAPAAPRAKPDCGPGRYRNPETNRCKKLSPAGGGSTPLGIGDLGDMCPPGKERNPATGRCVKQCLYGRNASTGRCNPKPKQTRAQKAANKKIGQMERKATTAVTGAITKGAQYVYKNLGPLGTVKLLAKASLVGAAGAGAYWLTKKLATLRVKTWEDARKELGQALIAARTAARKARPDLDWNDPAVNAVEMAPLNQYFKERAAILEKSEALGVPPHLEFVFDDDNPTYGNPYEE